MFNIEQNIINFYNTHKNIKWNLLKNEWKEYLINKWDDCFNIKESFFRIKYNILETPKCIICGKPAKFYGRPNYIYASTCGCKECNKQFRYYKLKSLTNEQKQLIKDKIKQTCLKKYGVEHYSNRERAKQTCLEKYGVENPAQTKTAKEKYKQTCLEKYGVESFTQSNIQKEKSKQTKLERYGDEYYSNRKKAVKNTNYNLIKEKAKQTCLEKYGDEYYSNREKAKQTCLEKYGVENPAQTKIAKEKYKQTCLEKYGVEHIWNISDKHIQCWNNNAIEHRKQTSIKHYGVDHPSKSQIVQNKINKIKRKNHTFNTSEQENKSYKLLKEKYDDAIYQYKSELYPYLCDFYIPSLDLYIECNYHWTHGNHPFNKDNNNDQLLLETWKQKNTKFYDNAIKTWTIRDVNKRNTVKENNLNYIEFWNINELKTWLSPK